MKKSILMLLMGFFLFFSLYFVKADYISGTMIVNVSDDTFAGFHYTPCCEFYNRDGCGSTYNDLSITEWNTQAGGVCQGAAKNLKIAQFWFNMSQGLTAEGNYVQVPWYLVKNATMKLWVTSMGWDSQGRGGPVSLYGINYWYNGENTGNFMSSWTPNKTWNTGNTHKSGWYGDELTYASRNINTNPLVVNTTSEWNVTDYVKNITQQNKDVMLTVEMSQGYHSASFMSKEGVVTYGYGHSPYLEIELNPAVCGDGNCTPVNETARSSYCWQDCGPMTTDLSLYLNGTHNNRYYLNGTYVNFTVETNVTGLEVNLTTNMTTGWTNQSGTSPFYKETQIICSQNNTWYNITGYYRGNLSHASDSETFYAICYLESTHLNLYLDGTDGDKEYNSGNYVNLTVVLNETGIVNLTTNITGWVNQGGNSPLQNISLITCNQDTVFNITGWFAGNSTHFPSSKTHYLRCIAPVTTTTIKSSGGGGGGISIKNKTTTTTKPITTIPVTNITTTSTTTTTMAKVPLAIMGKLPIWMVYIIGIIIGTILGAAIWITFTILRRKFQDETT
jgi:hypothetical protein